MLKRILACFGKAVSYWNNQSPASIVSRYGYPYQGGPGSKQGLPTVAAHTVIELYSWRRPSPQLLRCNWSRVQPRDQKALETTPPPIRWWHWAARECALAGKQLLRKNRWRPGPSPSSAHVVPCSLLVLHVLSPVHRGLCRSWRHRDCAGE